MHHGMHLQWSWTVLHSMPESTIKITLTAQKRNVLLSVESYGTPFSTDDMKRIFQKFYRIGTDSSGYGLGLSIAQSIVPCPRKSIPSNLRASSSNTRMNSPPIIFRFSSGSATSASLSKKRSVAST